MNDKIFKALGIFLDAMRLYVVSSIQQFYPKEPWEGLFFKRLTPLRQETWNAAIKTGSAPVNLIDYSNLSGFAISFKDELSMSLGRNEVNNMITWLNELKEARNKCQHFQELKDDEVKNLFMTMKKIANILKMDELVSELDNIDKSNQTTNVELLQKRLQTDDVCDDVADEKSLLTSWFNNVTPHYDIRQGALDESVFAANLGEVVLGNGREVYQNHVLFFQKTYVTSGLKNLANRVVRALNDEETENRTVSLQTGFGGGKTHSLITLYHIAKAGKSLQSSEHTKTIFDSGVSPAFDHAKVAVFTNTTNDPVQGRQTVEGFTIRTLWGELAYQLGGPEAYATIRENDEKQTAPKGLFKKILQQAAPCLVLIDELADYCVSASAVTVGSSNLSDQTISFIQELTEAVSSTRRSMMIATLPSSDAEVAASPVASQILSALENRLVRVGVNIQPVIDDEIFEVVRRRLFEDIVSITEMERVITRYRNTYQNRRSDLPSNAARIEYTRLMQKSYPFHPELINMFRLRWGAYPRFQRTRGVLRMLASIVSDLWQRRSSLTGTQTLIHTSDVNLANVTSLTGTITNLMGIQWETVIQADICGTSGNAVKIDNENPNLGRFNLTQGIATTLLLASFGPTQNKGINIADLKLCVLKPASFNHNDVNGALDKLETVAHYLYSGNVGDKCYWFHTKPNINILINQAKAEISRDAQYAEIIRRLESVSRSVKTFRVLVNPTGDIPEQKSLTLIVLPPVSASNFTNINPKTINEVKDIALYRGNNDRIYRNTILYLVCSETGLAALLENIKDYMACERIRTEYSGRIEQEQMQDLKQKMDGFSKSVDNNLIKAYNIVLKYVSKGSVEKKEIFQFANDFTIQIDKNIVETLKEGEWLLDSVGIGLLRQHNLLPTIEHPVRTNDLYEAFLRYDDKPMIRGQEAISKSILKYCENGEFNVAYGDIGAYDRIYHKETVRNMDVADTKYWIVDKSIYPAKEDESNQTTESNTIDIITPPVGKPDTSGNDDTKQIKRYKSLTISGKVPLERYTDLFSSFVVPLKNNHLQIEVKFKGKSTESSPLDESAQIYKVIKESANQLGLNLEEEEV